MTIADATIEFEKQLHSAVVVLDSGFGSRPGENDRVYRKRKELAEIALQALRAQMEDEKNEPLTLDELREMNGEPVWCVIKGVHEGDVPLLETWFLLQVQADDEVKDGREKALWVDNPIYCVRLYYLSYGEEWLAYRQKPKEEQQNDA